MAKKRQCTAYPHLILYIILNLLLFFFSIGFIMLLREDFGKVFRVINIALAILLSASFVIVFIFTTFSGWNGKVTFDNRRAWQKRWGKVYEWRWGDVCDITCRTDRPWFLRRGIHRYDMPPAFKMYCRSHKKVLRFCLTAELDEQFTQLCTNAQINEKFRKLISECNFYYSFKYNKSDKHASQAEEKMSDGILLYYSVRLFAVIFAVAALILFLTENTVAAIAMLACVAACALFGFVAYSAIGKSRSRGKGGAGGKDGAGENNGAARDEERREG